MPSQLLDQYGALCLVGALVGGVALILGLAGLWHWNSSRRSYNVAMRGVAVDENLDASEASEKKYKWCWKYGLILSALALVALSVGFITR